MNRSLVRKIYVAIKGNRRDIVAYEDMLSVILSFDQRDPQTRKYFHTLRKLVSDATHLQTIPAARQIEFAKLKERVLLPMTRWDVDSYFQYLEKNRPIDKRFYLLRRDQLLPIVKGFQSLLDDEIDFLAVSMPPRVGKTTAAIYFLTMLMGLYPDDTCLASGHSSILTNSFYDGVTAILTDPQYSWGEMFRNLPIARTNSKETTIELGQKSRLKTLTCRSIDGTLTGSCDANRLIYADDLCSGIEEAMSKPRLDKLWDKYLNDLKSRAVGKCKELHVSTRWSVHDVIGRLATDKEGNPRARFITMPATTEEGESNFNYRGGLGFDNAYYEERKRLMDDVSFRAIYMNEPIEREGLLFPEPELRRYYRLPRKRPDRETVKPPDAIIAIAEKKRCLSIKRTLQIFRICGTITRDGSRFSVALKRPIPKLKISWWKITRWRLLILR